MTRARGKTAASAARSPSPGSSPPKKKLSGETACLEGPILEAHIGTSQSAQLDDSPSLALTFPPKSPSHGILSTRDSLVGGGWRKVAGYVGDSNEAAAGRTEGENKEDEGGTQRGPA